MKSLSTALNRINALAEPAKQALLPFLFPHFCLHCQEIPLRMPKLFCSFCEEWVYRYPLSRCSRERVFGLEREGIALSLFKERSGSVSEEVIKTMSAFLILQLLELGDFSFDMIIPLPKDPGSLRLARQLSKELNIPCQQVLSEEGEWKGFSLLSDRSLLVVSVEEEGPYPILQEACPSKVTFLSFIPKRDLSSVSSSGEEETL